MAEYVCTLSDRDQKTALDELHEDPRERMSSIEAFRKWCIEQPHINAPTDAPFLLKFLRHAKFSQLKARETLEKFLTIKTENPDWFDNIDFCSPGIQAFLKSGYAIRLPRMKDGKELLMYRIGCLDPDTKLYKKTDVLKAIFGIAIHNANIESALVNGNSFLMDFSGFEFRHQTYWGIDTMKKTTKIWQGALPGRFKAFHYYNTGPVFEAVMAITRPLLSKKFQDRINIHGSNMENVYKVFPMTSLPSEYCPDEYTGKTAGSLDQLTQMLIDEVSSPEVRDRILYETDPKWKIEESKRITDTPQASFRKLNIE